ncbi:MULTISPECIES: VWA domain-containing protein [Natrialbaceae]|uniref:VWA domain-containing protein n=1 Tax=Natrialbaceae TaxID=1644061 RepID=UPI00207CB7E4|nr:VWA domain-containing protein [Natronococcus sp. CG52]
MSLVTTPALAGSPSDPARDEQVTSTLGQGANDGPPGNGNEPPGHERGADANVTIPTIEENTTVELLLDSRDQLEELDIEDEEAAQIRNESIEAIEASAETYREQVFADSKVTFEHQNDTIAALEELHEVVTGDDEQTVDRAKANVLEASNVSARLATLNAYETVYESEEEFRNPGQRQSAGSGLGNAVNAIERGDNAEATDAVTHYRNAWEHAERSLDVVEKNTDPELTLTQGPAFEENDTVTTPVYISLSDVRPYTYENAKVSIDDGDPRIVDFTADPVAGGVATGSITIEFDSELENRTITVETTSTRDSDRSVTETLEIHVDEDDIISERPDPDEYNEISVTESDSGVTVGAGGDGLWENDLSVTDRTPDTDDVYRAGPMVRIENRTAINQAEVTIPIEGADLDRDANLSIVTWDPQSDEPWTPIETEIDEENGTASAEVDHFSFFSVFWIGDWEDHTSDTITLTEDDFTGNDTNVGDGDRDFVKSDFVFVIDESGSMSGAPIRNAREASKRFVGALEDDERGGLVGYASSASLDHPLTQDHDALNASINRLSAGGGTNTEAGLRTGLDHLEKNGWENRSQVMILLSDGKSNSGSYPVRAAEDAADQGVEISTVGLGNSIDENELRQIAAATGGDFYHVEDASDLPDTFDRVAENQTGPELKDTNGDGIPNAVAEMDLRMPTGGDGIAGTPLNLDPLRTDTSGDGLLDNETVDINYRVFEENNETKLEAQVTNAIAHPARYDTANNGLSDYEEVEIWETDPMLADTSGDGFIDSVDPEPLDKTFPPDVQFNSQGWFERELVVEARHDNGIESIDVEKYVNPLHRSAQWQDASLKDEYVDAGWTVNEFQMRDERRLATTKPDELEITVAAENDYEVILEFDRETSELSVSTAYPVASRQVKKRSLGVIPVVGTAVATGLLAYDVGKYGYGALTANTVSGEQNAEDFVHHIPPTPNEDKWETPEGVEISLPSGAAFESDVHDGHERKHGWEQIPETPGIDQPDDVGEIVENNDPIDIDGPFDLIIGETNGHELIFWIYEGTLVFAQETFEKEEVAEESSEEINEERTGEEQVTEEEIEDTIEEEPDQVLDNDPYHRYEIYHLVAKGVQVVIRTTGEKIVDYFVEDVEQEPRCILAEEDIDMTVQETERGEFVASSSEYTSFLGTFERTANPVETELRCVDDPEAVIQTYADDPTDITDGSLGENVSVEFVDERGLDLEWPEDGFDEGDATEIGPDVVAYDESSDEWLIIEAKTTTNTEAIGKDLLETDAYEGDAQLHDAWIRNSLEKLEDEGKIDSEIVDEIDFALTSGTVSKELVLVKDVEGASHRTLRDPQNNDTDISTEDVAGIDKATIVELAANE